MVPRRSLLDEKIKVGQTMNRSIQSRRRPRSRAWPAGGLARRGAAAVEFAVVAPVLVLLSFGMVELGQFVNVAQIVTNASYEGVRQAARPQPDNNGKQYVMTIDGAVKDYLVQTFPNVPVANVRSATTVTVTSAGAGILGNDLMNVAKGSQISVQVVFQFGTVQWIPGFGFVDGRNVAATTIMQRQSP